MRALLSQIVSGESDSCPCKMSIRDVHDLLKESPPSLLLSLEWSLLSNTFLIIHSLNPVSYNVDPCILYAQSMLYDHNQIRKQWNDNKASMY